jgi:hypothetical protein
MPDREKKRRVKDPGLGESPYGVSVKAHAETDERCEKTALIRLTGNIIWCATHTIFLAAAHCILLSNRNGLAVHPRTIVNPATARAKFRDLQALQ